MNSGSPLPLEHGKPWLHSWPNRDRRDAWASLPASGKARCGHRDVADDAAYVLRETTRCHGFYGASSMEQLPAEKALTEQTRAFKRITF
jgi:hypothetical protein